MTALDTYNPDDYCDECGIMEWSHKDQDDRCLCLGCYYCIGNKWEKDHD